MNAFTTAGFTLPPLRGLRGHKLRHENVSAHAAVPGEAFGVKPKKLRPVCVLGQQCPRRCRFDHWAAYADPWRHCLRDEDCAGEDSRLRVAPWSSERYGLTSSRKPETTSVGSLPTPPAPLLHPITLLLQVARQALRHASSPMTPCMPPLPPQCAARLTARATRGSGSVAPAAGFP